ncbi:MAG: chromate transporter [Thermoplasmatota archaeon]
MSQSSSREPSEANLPRAGVWALTRYFLALGTWGFGGPVALVGYMHRDLVEEKRWVDEAEYKLALALAQVMPGPLAAQTAMAIGFFQRGMKGATLVGLAFILPSFLMVVALSYAYVRLGGLWWMQALFYGVGACVIAIIALAAVKLATKTNRRDPLLWGIFVVLFVVTALAQAELALLFILAGLLILVVRAPPKALAKWLARKRPLAVAPWGALVVLGIATASPSLLVTLFLFFAKAGAFVFGSGLAIVPFLHAGVVDQHHWLTEQQFLDAVAVAIITPGPVVITVAFIGYIVAGPVGALVAAAGMFLPVYLFTVLPAPWFRTHRHNPQLKAFVDGATAAATGAIAGAVIVLGVGNVTHLGHGALRDLPTLGVGLASLFVLWKWKLPEPLVVAGAGVAGLGFFLARGHGLPL